MLIGAGAWSFCEKGGMSKQQRPVIEAPVVIFNSTYTNHLDTPFGRLGSRGGTILLRTDGVNPDRMVAVFDGAQRLRGEDLKRECGFVEVQPTMNKTTGSSCIKDTHQQPISSFPSNLPSSTTSSIPSTTNLQHQQNRHHETHHRRLRPLRQPRHGRPQPRRRSRRRRRD